MSFATKWRLPRATYLAQTAPNSASTLAWANLPAHGCPIPPPRRYTVRNMSSSTRAGKSATRPESRAKAPSCLSVTAFGRCRVLKWPILSSTSRKSPCANTSWSFIANSFASPMNTGRGTSGSSNPSAAIQCAGRARTWTSQCPLSPVCGTGSKVKLLRLRTFMETKLDELRPSPWQQVGQQRRVFVQPGRNTETQAVEPS
mmetsp:Transcript_5177/g.12640  ORF Transcript_5177/g.12640 Transcript_5177/m.12640 type:complete len:201 (-) Transcript_5177:317-919(-)